MPAVLVKMFAAATLTTAQKMDVLALVTPTPPVGKQSAQQGAIMVAHVSQSALVLNGVMKIIVQVLRCILIMARECVQMVNLSTVGALVLVSARVDVKITTAMERTTVVWVDAGVLMERTAAAIAIHD